ncbi:MAG: circadian clock KaiB family protein [Halothece sp.]
MSKLFKGIALFTPGGDLIYCIDQSKQVRWHLHLCTALQEIFSLPELPHFLIPAYTATIDRRIDSQSQKCQTFAEIYSPVKRHQSLLNAVFKTGNLSWTVAPWQEECCDPMVLETYQNQFPQLWKDHDLIVHLEENKSTFPINPVVTSHAFSLKKTDYVLRLFVSGHTPFTEQILKKLHQVLEEDLHCFYNLKVIDISKHPEQAEIHHVSATPTLIRISPQPVRYIVGEFDNLQRLLQALVTY